MAKWKDHKQKESSATAKAVEETVDTIESNEESKKPFPIFYLQMILVFAASFILYFQTVNFQYALDDKLVITHNMFTKKGLAGIPDMLTTDFMVGFFGKDKNLLAGGRYRPLSLITFAVEWELMAPKVGDKVNIEGKAAEIVRVDQSVVVVYEDKTSQLFDLTNYLLKYTNMAYLNHLANVLMYAFMVLLLFIVLHQIFPNKDDNPWYFQFAFIASILYAVHPLHVEAVANVKGRDEIMSLFGALGALYFSVKYFEKKNPIHFLWASLCLLAGILSKEAAITYVAVIPMTLYFFTDKKIKEIVMATLPLVGTVVFYVLMRYIILGTGEKGDPPPELMNNPFLHATPTQKMATIFFTMGLYIKLLFFPHPLTHDYYPWHPLGDYDASSGMAYPYSTWADPGALISLLLYIALLVIAIRGIKSKTMLSYGILFYLGTFILVSNLIFPVGTLLNERFMYMPSIGFVMILAHFMVNYLPSKMKSAKMVSLALFGVFTLGYAAKTYSRSQAWKNDFSLSTTDVKVSFWSAKSNMSAGLAFVDESKLITDPVEKKKMLEEAIFCLTRSLRIYPKYIQPMLIMGNAYYELQDYENAITWFEECFKLNPSYEYAVQNMEHVGDLTGTKGQYLTSIRAYSTLLKYHKDFEARVYAKMGEIYGKNLGDLDNAIFCLEKAYAKEPKQMDILQKLGVVYAMKGRTNEAITIFTQALEQNPDNPHVLMNIGIAYQNIGQVEMANQYLEKAFTINPSLRPQK